MYASMVVLMKIVFPDELVNTNQAESLPNVKTFFLKNWETTAFILTLTSQAKVGHDFSLLQ